MIPGLIDKEVISRESQKFLDRLKVHWASEVVALGGVAV